VLVKHRAEGTPDDFLAFLIADRLVQIGVEPTPGSLPDDTPSSRLPESFLPFSASATATLTPRFGAPTPTRAPLRPGWGPPTSFRSRPRYSTRGSGCTPVMSSPRGRGVIIPGCSTRGSTPATASKGGSANSRARSPAVRPTSRARPSTPARRSVTASICLRRLRRSTPRRTATAALLRGDVGGEDGGVDGRRRGVARVIGNLLPHTSTVTFPSPSSSMTPSNRSRNRSSVATSWTSSERWKMPTASCSSRRSRMSAAASYTASSSA